ncbi:hypothetical protein [Corynebacterium doosanense]|uniref:Secreted protein n=1 Tax=Corynebacterium doosanense CAU 212 = DSM 45436 TaxID=558173 RepID=A0A097IJL4_9CORY|nr:hypothetical protein [Corynebacterium doosanense]AIT62293.1 hypothetical protein CDOO_08730 [Corynebacterium doosanense CAU 212 = DSM 45436]
MKKSLASTLAFATSIALVACGDSTDMASATTSAPTSAATSAADGVTDNSVVPGEPAVAAVGDTIQLATKDGGIVELTITDLTLGEECRYEPGTVEENIDPEFNRPTPGEQYLQVWGELDTTQLPTGTGSGEISLANPQYTDASTTPHSAEPATECGGSTEGHQPWTAPVKNGEKQSLYGAFVVPKVIDTVAIEGAVFTP